MLKLLGLFGGKWGLIAILVASLTIAGLWGYIKYQSAKNARDQIELRTKLRESQRDVRERDRVINVMTEERELYESRVAEIARNMEQMQRRMAQNTQQRRTDYDSMTRPRAGPGQKANIQELEDAANQGMNGLFNELEVMSQRRSNSNGRTPNEAR
jgi:hypothetical protein